MKLAVKITGIQNVNEIPSYWNNQDYKELLKMFDFPDVDQINDAELTEMLNMAITDFEPAEAAQIVLNYKLGDQLNEGQIHTISHEMTEDKVAEEYPEPELHYDLFNVNQLLYKAYNGTFPNTEASIIDLEVTSGDAEFEMTEEIMTKLIAVGLIETSLLKRLYSDQLEGTVAFEDAAKFIWTLKKKNETTYELLTSKYWIEKDDIQQSEYETEIVFFDEEG